MDTKKYLEMLNAKKAEIREMAETCINEERDMTEEERAKYDTLTADIENLNDTIEKFNKIEKEEDVREMPVTGNEMTIEEREVRAFEDYCLKGAEALRSGEQNLVIGQNGAIVPTTIINKVIDEVKERCPIFAGATMYSVKGTLKIPVWGDANGDHNITVAYSDDGSALVADAGKFTSVDLTGYLFGSLVLLGKRLENNAVFSVSDFVVAKMADEVALFIENELLNGTGTNAMTGVLTAATNTATATAITADALIELQSKVKQTYQGNCVWTMHPDTFLACRKLKDANNRYLLQDDVTAEFPYRILGKSVYLSENMPTNKVLYGDYSGMAVNIREGASIQVLTEKYAELHMNGIIMYAEMDSKLAEQYKFAVLTVG